MEDIEILALLEYIEWEGCDDSDACCPEEVIRPVCPSCQCEKPHEGTYFNNEGRGHHKNCQLVKAIAELRERPNRVGPCPYCKDGILVTTIYENYCTKIRGVHFVVDKAEINVCNSCNEKIYSAKELKRWEKEFYSITSDLDMILKTKRNSTKRKH